MVYEYKVEHRPLQNRISFICPSGFKLHIKGTEGILELLECLARRGTPFYSALSEILFIDESGIIRVMVTDDWENSAFTHKQEIANAPALAKAATLALREIYGTSNGK